jgi:hypothetical protein
MERGVSSLAEGVASFLVEGAAAITRLLDGGRRDIISVAKVSVRSISIPERDFLNVYFRVEAIVRVLECGQLEAELKKS